MATAVMVAGAAGVVPATAAGAPVPPPTADHSRAPHARLAPLVALPAEVGATVARGPGASQAGLAASSVAVAGDGNARWEYGIGSAAGRPGVDAVRARGPPS
jgi:hypothetical protein